MSPTSEHTTTARTYGGWRRVRGMGLFGLGPAGTVTVLATLTGIVVTGAISPPVLLVVAPLGLLVLAAVLVPWDGVTLGQALLPRLRWLAGRRGRTWRGGVMATHPYAWHLPGVLAATELHSTHDRQHGEVGVVHHRRLHTMTVSWRCAAQSTWLTEPAHADTWVANWAGWLASLGHQHMVRWVAVTVDTAPDPGTRLADHVTSRLAPDAPAAARHLLQQLVDASPQSAADVQTWVSVTLDPYASPARPRSVDQALTEVARALPGLADGLASCGLTILGAATADDLAAYVRGAFDPGSRATLALLSDAHQRDRLLGADNAGPVAAVEHPDRYAHDGAVSVSWAWHEAPRQPVPHDILARLVSPGTHPKRVTLLYRPLPAARAARTVEDQVNAVQFRTAYRRARRLDPKARDLADHDQALQAAREEAGGAGVGLVSLFATVTAASDDDLPAAVADLEARAEAARIRLRRLWRSQAAGFATTLPCGICPPVLARTWPH